jgi:hypothetical protein
VSELALFGSVVRGEAGTDSGIDFLYILPDPTIGIRFAKHHLVHATAPQKAIVRTAWRPSCKRATS